tara:strand:+ start:281 stop:502 length:222 start_codon:yes stop_codon:yes gene_type:complete
MTLQYEYELLDHELVVDITVGYEYDKIEKRVYLNSAKLLNITEIIDLLTEEQKNEIVEYMIDNYAFEESYPEE